MEIVFDPDKDQRNRQKHGLSLADVAHFDLSRAFVVLDERQDYGEQRLRAYGRIGGRLHVLAFTMRGGTVRPISFRKVNLREEKRYEDQHSRR